MSDETPQEKHDKKYPLCKRWGANFDKAMVIIDFLNWLCNGYPSEYVEEGHNCCIAQYGRYSTEPITKDTPTAERFGIALRNLVEGQEQLIPITRSVEDLAYEYFGIDRQEINKEREAMLTEVREQQGL